MPTAELIDGRIHIEDVALRDRDAIRELPGAKYRSGEWTAACTWPILKILVSLFPDRLETGEALRAWAWNEHATHIAPTMSARQCAMDPSRDVYGPELLYPYQRTGVHFLTTAQSALLGDDMGVGKTVQAITTAGLEDFPILVIAPKSAKMHWYREFEKWAPDCDVQVVEGSATVRRRQLAQEHDVYIVSWDGLRIHSRLAPYGSIRLSEAEREPKELNREWGTVIADEAHRAINPRAKQTRALWAVGATAKRRIPVTGTPIADNPSDFWSMLHFCAPDDWPSKTHFIERYCVASFNAFGGLEILGLNPQHADEFHSLVEPRFLRRPKELVLPWLPPKVYERRDVEMPPKQARIYRQFEEDMVADLDGGTATVFDSLTLATRLTQVASSCAEVYPNGDVRLCPPSSKVDALVELLEDMGDEPLVVFAQSRQLIDLAALRLEREHVPFGKVVGGQSALVRDTEITNFTNGQSRVLLLTMGAGSESIDLTSAATTCFMQRSWSLIENKQAEERMHRPGQEAPKVTIIDLVAPGTIEENQHAALQAKGERLEEIVRDRTALLGSIR